VLVTSKAGNSTQKLGPAHRQHLARHRLSAEVGRRRGRQMRDLAGTGTSGSIDDQGGGGGKGRVAGGVVAVGDGRCAALFFWACLVIYM